MLMLYVAIAILLLFAVCLSIANYAPKQFYNTYKKYSEYIVDVEYTAGDFAVYISKRFPNLSVARINGELNDAFYPKKNTICLTEDTIYSKSVSAFAVVAHEFGHAIQYNTKNFRFKFCMALSVFANIFSRLTFPLLIVGAVFAFTNIVSKSIAYGLLIAGASIFAISFLVKILTIPIEYEATNFGLKTLQDNGVLGKKGMKMARKVLKSAGLTYVSSLLASMLAWTFMVPKYKH